MKYIDHGYYVTPEGDVYSENQGSLKKLRVAYKDNGYAVVNVVTDGKRGNQHVHRLVAQAFIQNPEGKSDVNHKDGDKRNNAVDNLEWATRTENMQHASSSGLLLTGAKNPATKLTAAQVVDIRAQAHRPKQQIANDFGVSRRAVRAILSGETWKEVA